MSVSDKAYPWAWRKTGGTFRLRNIFQHFFGYTETMKKVAAASNTAILGATATVVAGQTITSGITDPDVPRLLKVVTGGTTADIAAGNVVISGYNVEGQPISESIALTDNQNGTTNGTKVFKRVTSIVFPAADGTTATISVGTQNAIGLNHRLQSGKTTIAVVQNTGIDASTATAQAAPSSSNVDQQFVEKNYVTPATLPDGTFSMSILYWGHQIKISPVNDQSNWYSTTTSTSSTSSSSSTSTSSTSTSTSSTSTSTSSTSTSTSSTSTSTTTTP